MGDEIGRTRALFRIEIDRPRPQELGLFSRHLAAGDGAGATGGARALTAAQRTELREVFEILCRPPSPAESSESGGGGGHGGGTAGSGAAAAAPPAVQRRNNDGKRRPGTQAGSRLALQPLMRAVEATGEGLSPEEVIFSLRSTHTRLPAFITQCRASLTSWVRSKANGLVLACGQCDPVIPFVRYK